MMISAICDFRSKRLMTGCVAMTIVMMITPVLALSQNKAELTASQKAYEGRWVNLKLQRHLTINYDNGAGYVTINDWHGKMSQYNHTVDAYKAWLKNGKLVMSESKTELRSPYCEIVKKGDRLLYRCKGISKMSSKFIDSVWFVRESR